jgi:hypothetical protein
MWAHQPGAASSIEVTSHPDTPSYTLSENIVRTGLLDPGGSGQRPPNQTTRTYMGLEVTLHIARARSSSGPMTKPAQGRKSSPRVLPEPEPGGPELDLDGDGAV